MRKQKAQPQKSLADFSTQEILEENQLKQIKGGDDPEGDETGIVTHEDVIEV